MASYKPQTAVADLQPATAGPAVRVSFSLAGTASSTSSPPATQPRPRTLDPKLVFFLGVILAASGLVSPPLALLGGLAFGITTEHPLRAEASALAKLLLQLSVILLGFGINLARILHAGRAGFVYTAASIAFAATLGLLLGKALHIHPKASYLITMGTAICGGSAIAALAPILQASEEDISVSMGTVFLLNSVALLLFPRVGWAIHLTQNQFGLWAALAIHDTSSVVGAAARFGDQALAVGTTVKLARALWIVPISLLTAAVLQRRQAGSARHRAAKVKLPWFILLFLLASVARTYLPHYAPAFQHLTTLGKSGLTVTLFLIGSGLSRNTLRQVGVMPLLQGIALWVVVAATSLAAIHCHWISI